MAEAKYNGWSEYQQSKLAAILFASELQRQFDAESTASTVGGAGGAGGGAGGASSYAACESDKWFINEQLIHEEEKKALAAMGPAASLQALSLAAAFASSADDVNVGAGAGAGGAGGGGGFVGEDGVLQLPASPHAVDRVAAAQLWEYSLSVE
jgi:hypothetical protein